MKKNNQAASYGWNEDSDERKLREALDAVNNKLDNLETTDEKDADEDNDRKSLWPSISEKDN